MRRVELLGARLDVGSMADTVAEIDDAVRNGRFMQHSVVNVAKLVSMRSDPALRNAVHDCDLVNVDGMGVVWGARFLGLDVPERVAGVDLFMELVALSAAKGYGIYLLGAKDEVVRETARKLMALHPSLVISGMHHGYFWDEEAHVVDMVRESGAKLLFVAISSPLKETFIARNRGKLGVHFVMGVGGTFDVIAGKVSRAPVWMQRAGLEWFYRLAQEPARMWRRYLVTNTVFAALLVRAKLGLLRN